MAHGQHGRVDPARCGTCSPTFCEAGLCADPAPAPGGRPWPIALAFLAFALASAFAGAAAWMVIR
ncbi:MAG TPA: hypothetical protein VGS97_19870 [Actinocrinis sp.]|uniref:hypothetical protein n=1 Tax=Actinocrinis sp. TaxID=1920516 RepID=UPI002DDDA5E0|nr:hypothetical protein [Actinocrinis sp.]HEV2346368.1 hypothetical protein [Actinocrinis sp.]